MKQYTITIDDEVEKALLTADEYGGANVYNLNEWINFTINNRGSKAVDSMIEVALKDTEKGILTVQEKQDILSALSSSGQVITQVSQLPMQLKYQIVNMARVKSGKEVTDELMPTPG